MATVKNTGVLILSPFYYPNIGGVETHLSDLTSELTRQKYHVFVLTYSPITTPGTSFRPTENTPYLYIHRFKWFGKNLFHTLEKFPLFDFLYLTPYLLLRSFIWMLFNRQKINIIHSHGFNAAFIGNVLGFIFNKRHLTSTHAVYDHISGFSQKLVTSTLNHTDHILCLSQSSENQLLQWNIQPSKLSLYSYWVDLSLFSPTCATPTIPTFLFIGRLIAKKGIGLFLKLSQKFPGYKFLIVGTGPEQKLVTKFASNSKNLQYLGFIPNRSLQPIYRQSSVLCVPSLYQEGFGRVVMEAVASGIPVISSNLGGLAEALDSTVAILTQPTLNNFAKAIDQIVKPAVYSKLKSHCHPYAQKWFSAKNISQITNFY